MRKPILLDAFCGVGGAARGYQEAGFYVVGIDHIQQDNYCGDDFIQTDAITFLGSKAHLFTRIHASPPCQSQTALTKGTNKGRIYPDLIPATRQRLDTWGGRYVIENVVGSSLRRDLTLCGEMFALEVIRHRYFEFGGGPPAPQPVHLRHRGRVAGMRHGQWFTGPYFAVYGNGGGKGTLAEWQRAMQIDWTDIKAEIAEAIPPAYTRYIAPHL